jgi:uncharacterized membrane protein YhaH (DUF805 family)
MKPIHLNLKRIGRTQFLAYTNLSYALLALIFYFTFPSALSTESLSLLALFERSPVAFIALSMASFLPLKFLAQRYRDAGLSGWWAMVGLIPSSYILLYFLMGAFRGEHYENRHGKTPEKTGIHLKILAYIPTLIFIGFIGWYLFTSKIN